MTEPDEVRRAPRTATTRPSGARTTAAVVVTDGLTDYLPDTLAALARQTRPADDVLVVDVGATADPDVARRVRSVWDGATRMPTVVAAPGARTFGEAVRRALEAVQVEAVHVGAQVGAAEGSWLWLLHDDSAPAPTALTELLRAVEAAPSVAVAGSKQLSWSDPVRVLEVGVATSRFGRRMTGIDEPEVDQGQYDGREDVLGVGIAGALVRRDVWEALGGTDPALGPYGDGLDLSRRARLAGHRVVVVPRAVVRHAQASLARPIDGAALHRPGWDARRSAQARREAYLHSQLVGVPVLLVPAVAVLAAVSGVVRGLGRLVTKEPHLILSELLAPWAVLLRPRRVLVARRRATAVRRLRRRSLRPLQVTWRDVLGHARDRRLTAAERRRVVKAPSELELAELRALRARRRGGLALVVAVAVAVAGVALAPLVSALLGGARLTGGALAAGDGDAGSLLDAIASGWAAAGLGRPGPADPLLPILLPLTAATGSIGSAASLILLTCLPVAAVGAWFAAGAATRSVALRSWAALVWAGAPTLLIGLGQARLGAVLAHAALPWVVLGVARAVGVAAQDAVQPVAVMDPGASVEPNGRVAGEPNARASAEPNGRVAGEPDARASAEPDARASAEPSLAGAAGAGLAFAVVTAGAPVLLPFGLLALLAVAAAVRGRRRRLLWVAAPALVLHGPLVVEAIEGWGSGAWRLLVAEPGLPFASAAGPAWQQLLGWPVEPPVWWALPEPVGTVLPYLAGAAVGLVAVLALVVPTRAVRAVHVGWLVAACGLAAAVVASRVEAGAADVLGAERRLAAAWSGPGLSLLLAGLLVAALVGAVAGRAATARHSFGWRQAGVAVVAGAAVLGPVLVLGTWTWHTTTRHDLELGAAAAPVVPAAGRQLQASPEAVRVLELELGSAGDVRASVLGQDGRQLVEESVASRVSTLRGDPGRAELLPPDSAEVEVAEVAGRLAAGASEGVAVELAALGVGAVLVPPADGAARVQLVGRIDSTAGLERVTETDSGIIWRVAATRLGTTAAWARLTDGGDAGDPAPPIPVAASGRSVDSTIPAASSGRVLVLAERADAGWRATLDGRPLRSVETTWRQAFELGPDEGRLRVWHELPGRTPWFVLQGIVLVSTLLLALPVRRRRGGAR